MNTEANILECAGMTALWNSMTCHRVQKRQSVAALQNLAPTVVITPSGIIHPPTIFGARAVAGLDQIPPNLPKRRDRRALNPPPFFSVFVRIRPCPLVPNHCHGPDRGTADSGVRPSPGAARSEGGDAIKFSRAIWQVHVAAPEDGRTLPAGDPVAPSVNQIL